MKPKVYVETTGPSYLMAWSSRDLIRAAHQQITREWWAGRDGFELYTSRLVVPECHAGDPQAAADRLRVLEGLCVLEQTADVVPLAEACPCRNARRRMPSIFPSRQSPGWIIC